MNRVLLILLCKNYFHIHSIFKWSFSPKNAENMTQTFFRSLTFFRTRHCHVAFFAKIKNVIRELLFRLGSLNKSKYLPMFFNKTKNLNLKHAF